MFKRLSTGAWIVGFAGLLLLGGALSWAAYEACWLGRCSFETVAAEAAAYAEPDAGLRVAVLRSEYTARFLAAGGNYDAHVEYWCERARKRKIPCEVISDSDLEGGLKSHRVLVLPSAVCLSEQEKSNIRAFLRDGKGVIATWATGTRDEKGDWKGWDFLRELTGADTFKSSERNAPWFVTFFGGSPLTAGMAAGSRIQVASPERLEAVTLGVDGYWSDARLFPADSALPANFQAALLHLQLERGRVVWYGFQENSAVAGGNDKALLDSTLDNSVAWAGQRPLALVEPWPFPYRAAAIFALDVREDSENAGYAADSLLKGQAKGTFFCWPETLKKNPELTHKLRRAGELAAQETPSTAPARAWMPSRFMRVESFRWRLRWAGGAWPSGFESPDGPMTPQTLRALAGGGFRYYLANAEGNSVLPTIFKVSQSLGKFHRDLRLVRLARMTDDDLHLSPLGMIGLDTQWIERRVLSDFEVVGGLGGLYVLSYHTAGLSAPQYAGVLSALAAQLRNAQTWVAAADDVASWWVARGKVSVTVSERDRGALRVTIVSRAENPIQGIVLTVYPPSNPPAGFSGAHVLPVGANNSPPPRVVPDPSNGRVKLAFGKLEPGTTYTYELKPSP